MTINGVVQPLVTGFLLVQCGSGFNLTLVSGSFEHTCFLPSSDVDAERSVQGYLVGYLGVGGRSKLPPFTLMTDHRGTWWGWVL